MFIDTTKIHTQAGNGGNGCISFLRQPHRPKGGPNGGNGGNGGNIILQANRNHNNLNHLHHKPHHRAQNGAPGSSNNKNGKNGKNHTIQTPCGTLIWQLPKPNQTQPTNQPNPTHTTTHQDQPPTPGATLIADLTTHNQQHTIAHGGRGGLGNKHFATPRNQTPRHAQPGKPGQQTTYQLELRTIADIGLIGHPNAGKSTLLTTLTNARPKTAPYPFTTLTPHIGTLLHPDHTQTTICDIPGLIQGAHKNAGLGHTFLRHIKRCKTLAYIIDINTPNPNQPYTHYQQLRHELQQYDPKLLQKKTIILANKTDQPNTQKNLQHLQKKIPQPILPIAATQTQTLTQLKQTLHQTTQNQNQNQNQN